MPCPNKSPIAFLATFLAKFLLSPSPIVSIIVVPAVVNKSASKLLDAAPAPKAMPAVLAFNNSLAL